VSYSVYRGTSTSGESPTPVATGISSTGYTDTSVTNGSTYFYTVRAVNSAGASPASNESSATPTAPSAFTLSLSPSSGTIARGSSGSSTVTVAETGPAQTVTLSVTGVPGGVTAGLSPASLVAAGTSRLALTVGPTAARGTYQLTVLGTGTSGRQGSRFTLKVR